ncbi:winged helix-turn-helix domain-containing protein [Bradyrhizobium pachyrhizi]|nr:tetratricopeptide repeat protein [Bradyrhizobium pachyrhizi]WFU52150.1 winged helix-turn-helix domain-containing protein [Bradyrhizobium pachyrhizi]
MRGPNLVVLAPQVFDLLVYLIRHRERMVSKDELINAIWGGRAVSDAALTTRVYVARTAIGDSGRKQKYIKTLARRGVRFVGQVEEIRASPNDRSPTGLVASRGSPRGETDGPSICVFAFTHTYPDRGSVALGELVSEQVRIELTRRRWLKVAAAVEGEQNFVGTPAIAAPRAQDCRYRLRGSVNHHISGRCRVSAEVVETWSGVNIWGERYDTSGADGLRSQRLIADAIARGAAAEILARELSRALGTKPDDLGAWEAYQLGIWHMSGCNSNAIDAAQHLFQQSVDLDPHFSSAHSALAWAHMMAASIYSKVTVAAGCELARPLVMRAIALDDADPEPRARLALLSFLNGDVESAIEEAETVLAVKPDCASALGVRGAAYIAAGHRAQGRNSIRMFLRLSPNDPVRPVRLTQLATSHYLDGDYEEAARIAKHTTQRFPQHPYAYRWLAAAQGQLGRVEEASAALEALRTRWPNSFEMYVARQPPSYCIGEFKPMLAGLQKAHLSI